MTSRTPMTCAAPPTRCSVFKRSAISLCATNAKLSTDPLKGHNQRPRMTQPCPSAAQLAARLCQNSFCDYASGLKVHCCPLCEGCSGGLGVFSCAMGRSGGPASHVLRVLTQSRAAPDAAPSAGPALPRPRASKLARVMYAWACGAAPVSGKSVGLT